MFICSRSQWFGWVSKLLSSAERNVASNVGVTWRDSSRSFSARALCSSASRCHTVVPIGLGKTKSKVWLSSISFQHLPTCIPQKVKIFLHETEAGRRGCREKHRGWKRSCREFINLVYYSLSHSTGWGTNCWQFIKRYGNVLTSLTCQFGQNFKF